MYLYRMFYRDATPYEKDPRCGVQTYGMTMEELVQEGWDGNFEEELQSEFRSPFEVRGSLVKGSWNLPLGVSIEITGQPAKWQFRNKDGELLSRGLTPHETVYMARGSYKLTDKPMEIFTLFVNEFLKDCTPMEIVKFVEEANERRHSPRHFDMQVIFECINELATRMIKDGHESMKIGEYTLERVKFKPEPDENITWSEPSD